jgi:hypothetical protein
VDQRVRAVERHAESRKATRMPRYRSIREREKEKLPRSLSHRLPMLASCPSRRAGLCCCAIFPYAAGSFRSPGDRPASFPTRLTYHPMSSSQVFSRPRHSHVVSWGLHSTYSTSDQRGLSTNGAFVVQCRKPVVQHVKSPRGIKTSSYLCMQT